MTTTPTTTRRLKRTRHWGPTQLLKRTPRLFRRIGNALAAAALFGGAISAITEHEKLGLYIGIAGIIGKFLASCFSEELEVETLDVDSPEGEAHLSQRRTRRRQAGIRASDELL